MRTRREARFRLDSATPGRRASADSTRVTQAAQLTPSTSKTVSAGPGGGGAGAGGAPAPPSSCIAAHPAQQNARREPSGAARSTGVGAGAPQWAHESAVFARMSVTGKV